MRVHTERWLNRNGLIGFLREQFGLLCNYYTISQMLRDGLPVHIHPARPSRLLFDPAEVRIWVGAKLNAPVVLPPAVRAALGQRVTSTGRPRRRTS
jgi:aromatic ring-cleaving dioxygenase